MSELSREEIIERLHGNIDRIAEMVIDAEQRAQRAEAECERLRYALNDHHQWARTHGHEMGLGYLNSWLDVKTRKALATPPPECEPEPDAVLGMRAIGQQFRGTPPTPEQTGRGMIDTESIDERFAQFERRGEPDRHPALEFGSVALERFIHDMMGEINRLRALQSNRVPKQTGDALAALERLVRMAEGDELVCKPGKTQSVAETVRRSLTASGVPYVPEEVRRLVERWGKYADEYERLWKQSGGLNGSTMKAFVCRELADELEQSLASAPADGWKLVPVEPTEEMLAAVDEAQMEHSANSLGADLPFEQAWAEALAAAPTDGREHD